jgi:replicative DNA helicase
VSFKVKAALYNFIHDPDALKKRAERKWQDTANIDVTARSQAGKSISMPRRIWVMKHRHGMMGRVRVRVRVKAYL